MNFKSNAFNIAALSLLACTVATTAHAQSTTLADWTFDTLTVATNNNPAPTSGNGSAASLGMTNSYNATTSVTTDDIVVGTTGTKGDTGANGLADTSNLWRVRGQTPGNGWSSQAAIGSQGVQFATNTTGYQNINISFDWYATTQGEANLELQYTTDGTTWTNAAINIGSNAGEGLAALTNSTSANTVQGAYISDNLKTNGTKAGQDWFQGLTATISDPAAANDANFAFRLVNASTGADNVSTQGTALNNTSGNWRFDNISVTGVTAITAAVPEPETYAMMLAGLVMLSLMKRRRNQ